MKSKAPPDNAHMDSPPKDKKLIDSSGREEAHAAVYTLGVAPRVV
ncbi:hypothetical protein GALL_202420 [mine drainage metagenome]|uniref:Uncharacterized protein n=1 Tax=mine drainage metagenome TaxID=410659 RepID=A0A1J5S0E4_9ZZZZ